MFFFLCWISPGIVVAVIYIMKWYKGNNITYADIELLAAMTFLGIFIPVAQKEILSLDDPRIFIYGRTIKKETL